MPPRRPLPVGEEWSDEDSYVESLLTFATSSDILRNLCGGIHILDFLTRKPDLYSTVLPQDWRDWFKSVEIDDVLDYLLRNNIKALLAEARGGGKGDLLPPISLLEYVQDVRRHCLARDFEPLCDPQDNQSHPLKPLPRQIAVGMKPKKMHEVQNFARYVDKLSADIALENEWAISHVVDFGSGQNYLGRTLASPPYNKHVIAVERKHHNINGAKGMDIYANLATKPKIMRNKKEFRKLKVEGGGVAPPVDAAISAKDDSNGSLDSTTSEVKPDQNRAHKGSMTYIEHEIADGYLDPIINDLIPLRDSSINLSANGDVSSSHDHETPRMMVVSLHSCGNLLHHGLRSLILNSSVSAVAMIGCCYNLMTERLGPATYKLPVLRPQHPRLVSTSSACDAHGFPISKRLEKFQHKHGEGVRMNITARMMAVQAPYNWGPEDSRAFFTRHFYRALLQRILLDKGVVNEPNDPDSLVGGSPAGTNASGTPLIVGSLKKASLASFVDYVREALKKLAGDSDYGVSVLERTKDLTDEEIGQYEKNYQEAKKNLSVIWSLMAFSAGVVESVIVVDRWLFLREQEIVQSCWVEPVFEYSQSPRNLVVVGVKEHRKR